MMMNMRDSKNRRIFAAVLAVLIVLAMIVPLAAYAL